MSDGGAYNDSRQNDCIQFFLSHDDTLISQKIPIADQNSVYQQTTMPGYNDCVFILYIQP